MAKEKKEKKGEKQEEARAPEVARHSAKETPRLKSRFDKEIAPVLMKQFDLKNPMAVPRLHKIVVNMGMGEATRTPRCWIRPCTNWVRSPDRSRSLPGPRNRLPRSKCARDSPLAPWSRCGVTACRVF